MLSLRLLPLRAGLVVALAGMVFPAFAGDWKLSDSLSTSLTLTNTDNDGGTDDSSLSWRLTPGLTLRGTGGRVQADISYRPSLTMGSGNNTGTLSHRLSASGKAEILPQQFFLGATATAGLTTRNLTSASVNEFSSSDDTTQTFGFTLTPEFRHHLGTYADLVSVNSLRYTTAGNAGSSDTFSRTANIGLDTGRRFGRLGAALNLSESVTYLDTREDTRRSLTASGSYRLDRKWSVRSSLGYSESDAPSSRSDNSAIDWTLGATWTPNPRTTLSAQFGHSFSGYNWSSNLTHRSRRTVIQANFSRALTNSSTLIAELLEAGLDAEGNPVLDPITGLPLLEDTILLVPTDENFIRTALGTTVTLSGRRTTLTGRAAYNHREFDVTGRTEETITLRLNASRSLAANFSATAGIGYSDLTSSSSTDDSTYDASLGLSRTLGPRSSLSANLSHRIHDRANGTGFTEQRFTLTFSTSFL